MKRARYNASVLSFQPSGDIYSFRDGEGEALAWFPAPRVVACRMIGEVSANLARSIYATIDSYAATHGLPVLGFADFSTATGFESEARSIAVRWNIANQKHDSEFHILVESLVARVAARLFAIVLRDIVNVHSDYPSFVAAYSLAKGKNTKQPAPSIAPASMRSRQAP